MKEFDNQDENKMSVNQFFFFFDKKDKSISKSSSKEKEYFNRFFMNNQINKKCPSFLTNKEQRYQ